MVMHLPPRSSSAGLRSIHRELQRRRAALAPRSSVAKKPSAPPRQGSSHAIRDPRPRSPHREAPSSSISISRGSAGTDASAQPRPGASSRCNAASPPAPAPPRGSSDAVRDQRPRSPHREITSSSIFISRGSAGTGTGTDASAQPRPRASSRCKAASPPPPPPRSAPPSAARSACPATPGVPAHLRPGTVVGVRTRTTTLKTGQVLVLWLKATVVSSTHDGYEVVYDKRPPCDPKSTVCVPRHHVRVIKPSPSPTTTPPPCLPPPTATKKEVLFVPAPRPTNCTAGKRVRVIRSLLPEMERQARADSGLGL